MIFAELSVGMDLLLTIDYLLDADSLDILSFRAEWNLQYNYNKTYACTW
jgi:hypothetical protein